MLAPYIPRRFTTYRRAGETYSEATFEQSSFIEQTWSHTLYAVLGIEKRWCGAEEMGGCAMDWGRYSRRKLWETVQAASILIGPRAIVLLSSENIVSESLVRVEAWLLPWRT